MTLGDYLASNGLKASAFAARLGVDRSTVGRWLSGVQRPDWDTLEKIHAATGGAVTANDFMGTTTSAPGGASGRAPAGKRAAGRVAAAE